MATVPIVTEVTYSEMASLLAANDGAGDLNLALSYKITDRGDRGLLFRAAAPNMLESTGIRYMLCPATYATGEDAYSNDWIGVWNAVKQETATTGQLTIWNGLVWVAGAELSGDSPDTEASGWTVIPKASFTNHEYVEMIFGVSYDFENDWISKQWDKEDNKYGVPYSFSPVFAIFFGITGNPVDATDWNWKTTGYYFFGNTGYVCSNNSNEESIYNNTVLGIVRNSIDNEISANYGEIIIDNSRVAESTVKISQNKNFGTITGVWDADVTDTVVDKTGTAE